MNAWLTADGRNLVVLESDSVINWYNGVAEDTSEVYLVNL